MILPLRRLDSRARSDTENAAPLESSSEYASHDRPHCVSEHRRTAAAGRDGRELEGLRYMHAKTVREREGERMKERAR